MAINFEALHDLADKLRDKNLQPYQKVGIVDAVVEGENNHEFYKRRALLLIEAKEAEVARCALINPEFEEQYSVYYQLNQLYRALAEHSVPVNERGAYLAYYIDIKRKNKAQLLAAVPDLIEGHVPDTVETAIDNLLANAKTHPDDLNKAKSYLLLSCLYPQTLIAELTPIGEVYDEKTAQTHAKQLEKNCPRSPRWYVFRCRQRRC